MRNNQKGKMENMASTRVSGKNEAVIESLAVQLFDNHIRSSIQLDHENDEICKIGNVSSKRPNRRLVVVVGAAGSYEAGVAGSAEAVELLKDKLQIVNERLNYDIERLSTVYRLKPGDFETQLLAISYQSGFELRNELKSIFSYRYYPILSYEILAHLLKHRFVDAIINFNFDELLDQAIDDEFGGGEYCKVISDGDIPEDEPELFAAPIYIKPHGTSSHPSSLRFTREDYFGLPKGIKDFIERILTSGPLTIVSIGFAMQSFEFNHIALKAHSPSEIFYLNVKEPEPDPELKNYVAHFIKIPKTDGQKGISICLEKLWEKLFDLFRPYYSPKIISRHRIVSRLFAQLPARLARPPQYSTPVEDDHYRIAYLKNRTIIETIIFIARAKGLVNMNSLKSGRSGKYFDLFFKEARKTGNKHNLRQNSLTLPIICKEIGFKEWEYGQEAFILNQLEERRKLKDEEFKAWVQGLKDNSLVSPLFKHVDFQKDFVDPLFEVFKGTEVEITYGHSAHHEKVFNRPVAINTFTALKWHTLKILEAHWDTLLVVAETGEWLNQERILNIINSKGNRKIFLLIADPSCETSLHDNLSVDIEIKQLPWWVHNKHMTICFKKRRSNSPAKKSGIYFIRRMRSPIIDAVRLENDDCDVIRNIFASYWAKAKKREKNLLDTVEAGDIDEAMNEILS